MIARVSNNTMSGNNCDTHSIDESAAFLRFGVILCILLRYHYRSTISRFARNVHCWKSNANIAAVSAFTPEQTDRYGHGRASRRYPITCIWVSVLLYARCHREASSLAHTGRAEDASACTYWFLAEIAREREREKREMASSHLPSKALRTDMHVPGPSSTIVWRTFRERRRESRACVRIIATTMPIRSVARKFNASSRPFSLALMVAWDAGIKMLN